MFSLVVFEMLLFQFNVKETRGSPLSDYMPGPEESWSGRKKNRSLPTTLAELKPIDKTSQLLMKRNSTVSRILDRTESFISITGI